MNVYSSAAARYRACGWWPVPVHGKTIPAGGATGYAGTVTDEKVAAWIAKPPTVWVPQEDKTRKLEPATNITLRHQLTVAIDVDEYGEKNGVVELERFARSRGLSPLPATWSSTARGPKSGSRQYLYRVEADVPLKTKPCTSVEVCCWHHRHTVVAPTIHPKLGAMYTWYWPGSPGLPPTWGEATDAVPIPTELPFLPADWFEVLRNVTPRVDPNTRVVGLDELLETFPDGEPDGLVHYLMRKWSDPRQHVGHDEVKTHGINILMLGREGHPGVPALWELFIERYADYLRDVRPDEYDRDLYEDAGIVATVVRIAQQKPLNNLTGDVAWRRLGFDPSSARSAPAVQLPPNAATDEELLHFVQNYRVCNRPNRLGRRTRWMKTGSPSDLLYHAQCMVEDVLIGHYPARAAFRALTAAYELHGGTDPSGAVTILRVALGAALDAPRKATA